MIKEKPFFLVEDAAQIKKMIQLKESLDQRMGCVIVGPSGSLLYSTLLYSTLLYSTLLYSALLYSTLLYSTLLYFTLISLLILLYLKSYTKSFIFLFPLSPQRILREREDNVFLRSSSAIITTRTLLKMLSKRSECMSLCIRAYLLCVDTCLSVCLRSEERRVGKECSS